MIEWEDGKKVSPARVNEDGTITPAVYEGKTPLSAHNLNLMQQQLLEEVKIPSDVFDGINKIIQELQQEITELKKPKSITTGEEYETGNIIDGKVEYARRIDCGTLPNNSSLVIETGLSNVRYTRKPEGHAQHKEVVSNVLTLPYIDPRDSTSSISLSLISGYKIAMVTLQDRTAYNVIVTVYYVKED